MRELVKTTVDVFVFLFIIYFIENTNKWMNVQLPSKQRETVKSGKN